MNQNTAGAVLLLVLAAAGFVHNNPMAWGFVALTAALAFVAQELREAGLVSAKPVLFWSDIGAAVLSWVTIAVAALSLV
ncbi:hypothetical protein [Mesorhizobium sp. M1322]|uniref:hypothetical protein n=1 Tax=Mesorhizobium sp. M1322 TaxID=2957081 RepID=UPI00333A9930